MQTNEPTSRWLNPDTYRLLAAVLAAGGSLLMTLNWPAQNWVAFAGIIVLFVAASVAIAGVFAGLRIRSARAAVHNLVIMLWAVLLPLVLLARQVHG